jgi:diguanylate cyclase (GGDEF)-like protein
MSTNWIQRLINAAHRDDAVAPATPEPTLEADASPAEDYERPLFTETLAEEAAHDDDVIAAVLLVDIDQFERVNAQYGREVGDAVMRIVASRLRSILRETDSLVRWGGDEFAILAPGMAPEALMSLTDRARRTLTKAPIVIGDATIELTASVGAVLTSPELPTPDDILAAAAQALYEAKLVGGDCARVYEPEVIQPEQP